MTDSSSTCACRTPAAFNTYRCEMCGLRRREFGPQARNGPDTIIETEAGGFLIADLEAVAHHAGNADWWIDDEDALKALQEGEAYFALMGADDFYALDVIIAQEPRDVDFVISTPSRVVTVAAVERASDLEELAESNDGFVARVSTDVTGVEVRMLDSSHIEVVLSPTRRSSAANDVDKLPML